MTKQSYTDKTRKMQYKERRDDLIKRIHFSSASLDELTKKELNEDIQKDCQRVIDQAAQAFDQLLLDTAMEALPDKHSFDSGILSPNETAAFNEAIDQTRTRIKQLVGASDEQ